ncbi:MAG: sulfide:quinone oxidoreductase [Solirubrobacteraceae bacterium]|jgi:sulfide:quinone oxidoreductase|nr:sulfide:quinone oxidoreductase [Solirubrobacteraceae bacterium]
MTIDTHQHPLNVLIAGGGVAALEAMMALHALAGDRVRVTLLAPERNFHYRPMAVAEPFTIAHARRVELARITDDFDAQLVTGALAAVEPDEHCVVTRGGERISYDALIVASGTRSRPSLDGAVTIDDRNLGGALRGLVQDVEEGYVQEIAFVAPANAGWPLPLYELALMTAHRAYDMNVDVEISIVSSEGAPLAMFGTGISDELTVRLADAGITFHGSSCAELAHGELTLRPSGERMRPGRVVALPYLEGPLLRGIETDAHGFIPVSERGEVHGVPGVYAAGDATWYPIKHGGIAAQQADVVAATIAAKAGVGVEPEPLRPVLRGMLLTGDDTIYLEARLAGDGEFRSTVSDVCPWEPPTKIVARHLGPYLAHADRTAVRA